MFVGKLFEEYYWKGGKPQGIRPTESGTGYKIVSDPYGSRLSIERYQEGRFLETIYDSILLNFKKLKPSEQNAWHKEIVIETEYSTEGLIRNQDDRVLFKEVCVFEKRLCRECKVFSVQGILLSIHRMTYTKLGDKSNEITLFDSHDHPVMWKSYAADQETGEFTDLLEEKWDFSYEPISGKVLK
jgi:hypothetical protein